MARFEVTQPITPTWVSGQVVDAGTSNGVGGAYVRTDFFADHRGNVPGCWTDTNGAFRLQIPDGFPLDNLADISTMKPGCFMMETTQAGYAFSEQVFTNDLVAGENALPQPLYLVQQTSGEYFRLSGHIYDEETNALPGVLLSADSEDDLGWGLGVTDTNGFYELFVPTGSVFAVFAVSEFINLRGLMGTGIGPVEMTADQEHVDLYCPRATALARGSVTDAVTGQPIVGVSVVYEYGDGYYGVAATLSDGSYEQGVVEGVWNAFLDGGLGDAGYPREDCVEGFENISLPGSGVFTNASFVVAPGYVLSGHVYDTSTNALAGGFVEAREPANREWMGGSDVNRSGYYEILLPTGTYRIATWEYHEYGYLNMAYSNYFTWDNWNHDPVTVTSNGVSGIDLYLPHAAHISGVVLGDSLPLAGADVAAFVVVANDDGDTDWFWHGSATSGEDGRYAIAVPAGTNYIVRAAVYDAGTYWLQQLYDEADDDGDALRVSTDMATPATNINFHLQKGGAISGYVYLADGVTPLGNCHVNAHDYNAGAWGGGDHTGADGFYRMILPPGTYRVMALPSIDDHPYVDMLYENTFLHDEALPVSVVGGEDTPGVDFTLVSGGTISGHVFAEDGITPVVNCHVYTEDFNTGSWQAGSETDSNGYYALRVAAGTYRVRASPSQNGQALIDEWYDNVWNGHDATPVMVTASNETSGIDFVLSAGATISGYVFDETGTNPLANIRVAVLETNHLSNISSTYTDSNGAYSVRTQPGRFYVHAEPGDTADIHAAQWYEYADWKWNATTVEALLGNDTTNINFSLRQGMLIEGHVYDETGTNTLSQCLVQAGIIHPEDNSNYWVTRSTRTDSNGAYSLTVPGDATIILKTGAFSHSDYLWADKFYNNTYDLYSSAMIATTWSAAVANVDFVLSPAIVPVADPLETAVSNGIAWLVSTQNTDGSWGTRYKLAKTSLSLLVLETLAYDNGFASPLDPDFIHRSTITNGLRYIFENALIRGLSNQSAGNPDADGDGIGVYFNPASGFAYGRDHVQTYNTSIALMAIAASRSPTSIVIAAGSPVDGWTYAQVVQDIVDYLAWGQVDSGAGRGGWDYTPYNNQGERGDQSNTGWVSLGLTYAEQCIGVSPPAFVRNEMNIWINTVRNQNALDYFGYGGSDYDPLNLDSGDTMNPLLAGNLLQEMAFLGDVTSTPRAAATLDHLARNWENRVLRSGGTGKPICYHTTYAVMKGLEGLAVEKLGDMDWFGDLSETVLSQQTVEGWWQDWNHDDGERILSTTWALLTLQTAVVFNQPPVPIVDVSPTNGPAPLKVTFDFMNAYDPDGRIVRCEIDKEGDGVFETTLDDLGTVIVEYPKPGTYQSFARVTDNAGATGTTSIHVTVWGTAPVAAIQADQDSGTAPLTVTLDASASSAAPGSQLVSFEWDLTGNGTFDKLSSVPTMAWIYRQPGTYTATVSVMDDQGLQDSATVTITVSAPPIPVPEVTLTATPLYGYLPMNVTFSAVVTNTAEIAEYRWDFDGNGTDDRITTTGVVNHVYQQAGTYAASVTVLSTTGLSTNATVSVNVRESSQHRVWISKPPQENASPRPVWGNAVSLIGHVAPANATVSVQFEYGLATTGNWMPIGSVVYPQPRAYHANWNVTGLLDGSNYNLRALATLDTDETVVSETYTVLVSSNAENLPRGIAEWAATADKPHGQKQVLDRKATTVSDLHDGTSVTIPAECIDTTNAAVTVEIVNTNTNSASGAALGKANIGANRKVSISEAPALGKPITIVIPYPDDDHDGIVDGTAVPERTIEALWFDVVSGTWKKPLSTEVNTRDKKVKIQTYHLTEFGLWGSRNLLNPDYGGLLQLFSSEAASTTSAANLTDGNPVSYWKSAPNPDTQEFVYAFTNHMAAIFDRVVIRNHGETHMGMTNYSAGFAVHTAMDGTNFSLIYAGVLEPTDSPQTFDFGVVTGRQVKLLISSGVYSQTWAMAEFEVHGELTLDANTNGIPDWWEWEHFGHYHVNPDEDADADDLDNRQEFEHGGNPNNPDSDGDGLPDGWKIRYGFRIGENVANLDSNNNGLSNWQSYIAGIDPTNINARFILPAPELGDSLVFTWNSVSGRYYTIFARTNLLSGAWQGIYGCPGNGGPRSFTNEMDGLYRYYRIGVEIQQ